MDIKEVNKVVSGLPNMTYSQAKRITKFIQEHDIKDILELGFRHGVSTCYMAATLKTLGRGSITTIDLEAARNETPNIESLLELLNLRGFVKVYYEPTSYNWRLMKMLKENPQPKFDFCYIDGAHNWFVDGFAFFLVDRLLRPSGWIIFDDLDWTYASSPALRNSDTVKTMASEERETPQIRNVYELLIMSHPSYNHFQIIDNWAYAQKLPESSNQ